MIGGSVPLELLLLALVGLAGFGLGWWLRRDRSVKEIKVLAASGPSTIVQSGYDLAPALAAEPVESVTAESAATLAVASREMQHRHHLPPCPTCGSRMELRVFKEKKIWVCEEFPVCRGAQMAE